MEFFDGEQLQKLSQLIFDQIIVDRGPRINGDKEFFTASSYSAARAQAYYTALNILEKSDFREVVRCKDCMYWYRIEYPDNGDGICNRLLAVHNAEHPITLGTHFCSYGERKER